MIDHVQKMPPTFTVRGLPVKVERWMLVILLGVMPILFMFIAHWRRSERTWREAWAVGWLYFLVLLTPDVVHITGHALSARRVEAPMDAVYLPVGMPRTIYYDNDFSPEVHIQRSLGGPVASLLAWVGSIGLFLLAPAGTLFRELAGLAVWGHGIIGLGSLLPIPGVDGAIIRHWQQIKRQNRPVG